MFLWRRQLSSSLAVGAVVEELIKPVDGILSKAQSSCVVTAFTDCHIDTEESRKILVRSLRQINGETSLTHCWVRFDPLSGESG